ncbi:MAG: hypothetical protein HC827_18440 [Cyanobacteria bacterium RM1_2_2]|nr:hypothetical protein [Cyanobacteria bacterium RM1_2_2]
MRFDFRSQVTRFLTVLQTHYQVLQTRIQTQSRSFRSAISRLSPSQLPVLRTKAGSIQASLALSLQAGFRALRLRLSALTKLNPQSLLLRLMALGAAALLTVLVIGGIQTITRETWSSEVPEKPPQLAQSPTSPAPQTWAGYRPHRRQPTCYKTTQPKV